VSGSALVFAAASLTEPFSDEQTTLRTEQPGVSITYNFAGSGALVTQIQQGAPADVIATADTASMKKLTDAGLVEAPVTFARNKLEIFVGPGNPKQITTLNDLARSDIRFVTEDDTVPAGKYSAQILSAAGVTTNPVSKELDVKSAVAKVTSGEADATIVYVTDVTAAGSSGAGVTIPDAQNVVAEYPIAIVKATKNHDAAATFIDAIVKGSGQTALHNRGFLPPT
jgi:molybdate transport system substrate-binding protein